MYYHFKLIAVSIFLIYLSACSPSRYVKPLQKKQQVISGTFGGPLIKFSSVPIPIPFTTLGYAYGLTNAITGYANLHTTSLLFGNAQTDIGATFELYKKDTKYGITTSPSFQFAYNVRNLTGFKMWPSLDLNGYYHLASKPSYIYFGANTWVELAQLKAHEQKQTRHLLPNLQCGYTLVKTKWQHQFELKYLGLGIANTPNVADYIGIVGKGSLGVYYCLIRKF